MLAKIKETRETLELLGIVGLRVAKSLPMFDPDILDSIFAIRGVATDCGDMVLV